MNVAVVLAGGIGSRVGGDVPKQFLELEGRAVIEYSVDAFEQSEGIDEIALVIHPDWMDHMRVILRRNPWRKVRRLLPGGKERHLSSLHAIEAYAGESGDTNLLLHDAARPWVSAEIVGRVVTALQHHEAVAVGIPSTDTVWEVSDGIVRSIPERKRMWLAQTPQAFRLPLIREAYRRALQDPDFSATDDCGVVLRYMPDVSICVVAGDVANKKITFIKDISVDS